MLREKCYKKKKKKKLGRKTYYSLHTRLNSVQVVTSSNMFYEKSTA